jgi:hypothetical protein
MVWDAPRVFHTTRVLRDTPFALLARHLGAMLSCTAIWIDGDKYLGEQTSRGEALVACGERISRY